ncbi:hypothetical protein Pcal_1329 [Pyrobaculum calidifontis JCM 11548]|uniref:Yip1 domain-containing protein n=1 Tax=Pyrobaculum calidifontis (strain DSM 21063 / JCM 11548 / VA1) TaxID=410359 RepID=A3MVT4_PYRCJ|nr:hypothetical protein Pcal_1329 [Pyrobaculum calidifontis JCM 11548]
MTDCLDLFLQRKLPYFFADLILWAVFLVELRWLLALRGKGAGTSAFYMWQYASIFVLFVVLSIFSIMSSEFLAYIRGVTDCLEAYERGFGWIFGLGFVAPIWGLAITSYAACAVLGDKACKILMPVLVLRTIVTGLAVYANIVLLTQNTSLWLLVIIYYALFATYYIIRTWPR